MTKEQAEEMLVLLREMKNNSNFLCIMVSIVAVALVVVGMIICH